jgi:hypothetical protein
MTTLNKGSLDARTYHHVSRLVQYRWRLQVLELGVELDGRRNHMLPRTSSCGGEIETLTILLLVYSRSLSYYLLNPVFVPEPIPTLVFQSINYHYIQDYEIHGYRLYIDYIFIY